MMVVAKVFYLVVNLDTEKAGRKAASRDYLKAAM
jgi:hypothetical protein